MTTLLLGLFSGYVLLDAFVIPKEFYEVKASGFAEGEIAAGENEDPGEVAAAGENEDPEEVVTADEAGTMGELPELLGTIEKQGIARYDSETVKIELAQYFVKNTMVYAARIVYGEGGALNTAFSRDTYGKNIKEATSEIAKDHHAILAINGDFYGARNKGYVIREGVLYRETGSGGEDLVIYEDGSFGIIEEEEITAKELLEQGAWNVLSFGPALVMEGEIAVTKEEEVGKAMASNPRTAIGICADGSYLMVVSDGRTSESEGLNLYGLAEIMQALGAKTAYNLDGGGSSTMVFQGSVINKPTTGGRRISERSVSDIVYVGE